MGPFPVVDMRPAKGNVVCAGRAHILRRAVAAAEKEGKDGRAREGDFDATDERDSGKHVCWKLEHERLARYVLHRVTQEIDP